MRLLEKKISFRPLLNWVYEEDIRFVTGIDFD